MLGQARVQRSARTPEAGMTFAGSFSEVRLDSGEVRVTRLFLGTPSAAAAPGTRLGLCLALDGVKGGLGHGLA